MIRFGFLLLALLISSGCIARTLRPTVNAASLPNPQKMDYCDWGAVLGQAVVGDRVDYDRLREDPRPLERFLARVAVVGPNSTPSEFPTKSHCLAYTINCHNATVLRSVLALSGRDGIPATLPGHFDTMYAFQIDGRTETPQSLRNRAMVLGDGDWRVALVLTEARLIGPPLNRRVFLPELLDGQLTQAADVALASPGVVALSHGEHKQLQLCRALFDLKEKLVADYRAKTHSTDASVLAALLDRSDRARREQLNAAVGYDIAMMPDLGAVNAVTPPMTADQQSVFSRIGSFSIIKPARQPE
ncbi:MAG: hypothetical protein HZA51_15860 [Planctomycetes bacterium]|nr:hypothetical protein [Planctomycetota bacterium]